MRKRWLLGMGFGAIALFYVIRGINGYGDLVPLVSSKDTTFTIFIIF
ncbi:MAG: hypothetical protein R2750_14095 [Bacteroidales bacterium]